MDDKALEAAANALLSSLAGEEDFGGLPMPDTLTAVQATIEAYHAALPSDYAELVSRLSALSITMVENEYKDSPVADAIAAIEALEASREIDRQTLAAVCETLTRETRRAEAAEARFDSAMSTAKVLEGQRNTALARVRELETALGDVVICWDLPVGLRRSSSSYENRMAPHMNRARAALEQADQK